MNHLGRAQWWLAQFSEQEREYIESVVGSVLATQWLYPLAGWFRKKSEDRALAQRILDRAEEEALFAHDIMSQHYTYQEIIQLNYRWRDEFPDALDSAITACRKQIAIAPQVSVAWRAESYGRPLPFHVGYEQLAIILEKQKAYSEAIDLCGQGESEGWSNDWAKRSHRLRRKADRVTSE